MNLLDSPESLVFSMLCELGWLHFESFTETTAQKSVIWKVFF